MNKQNILPIALIIFFIALLTGALIYKKAHSKKGSKIYNTRILSGSHAYKDKDIAKYEVHGIDVSHHQGNINWSKIKHPDSSKQIDFVFIRATVGTRRDSKFKKNWRQAKKHGFSVGAYHYYWPNKNSTIQANNFIKRVELEKGDFPPVLDIEKLSQIQNLTNLRKGLKNWISIVEKHYGTKPIIYTGDSFFRSYLKPDSYFRNYPRLWIANYNNVRSPKSNWDFWQYSDRVKISGINELVDVNVFKGDSLELNKLKLRED